MPILFKDALAHIVYFTVAASLETIYIKCPLRNALNIKLSMRLFGSNALHLPENAVPTASIDIGYFTIRGRNAASPLISYGRHDRHNCGLGGPM